MSGLSLLASFVAVKHVSLLNTFPSHPPPSCPKLQNNLDSNFKVEMKK